MRNELCFKWKQYAQQTHRPRKKTSSGMGRKNADSNPRSGTCRKLQSPSDRRALLRAISKLGNNRPGIRRRDLAALWQLCRWPLQELCPKDIYTRIRFGHIQNVPKERLQSSQAELKTIIAGKRLYPMTIIIITRRQSKRFALRERKRSLKSVLQKRQRQLPITRIPARVTSPSW